MHLSHTDQLACNKQLQKEREYHGLHAADKMEDILVLCISQSLCSWLDNKS